MARLDERLARSPVRDGFVERQHFADAAAALWLVGELVHVEDLVLHDAHMDIRTPTHELTRAHAVLRTRRRILSQKPDWALGREGFLALTGRGGAMPAAEGQKNREGQGAGTSVVEADGRDDVEDEVRTLLKGVSRQAIDKRVREGSLLAVPGPSNRRSYPAVQFNRDGSVVSGLKAVREALPTRSPWGILNFLVQPDDRLGGRKPIDVLKSGDIEIVTEAARRYGELGA